MVQICGPWRESEAADVTTNVCFQERIAKSHGTQCGFCTPGMVMSIYTLLRNHPQPSEEQRMAALGGRCDTGGRQKEKVLHAFPHHPQDLPSSAPVPSHSHF